MGARVFMETMRTVMLLCLIPLGSIAILLTLLGMVFPFVAFLENSFKSWFSFYLPVALSTLVTQVVFFAQNTLCATMLQGQTGTWGQLLGMVLQFVACTGILSSVKIAKVLVNGLVSPPDLSPESLGLGKIVGALKG